MIYAGWLEFIWALVAFAGLLAALLNWSEARYDWNKWKTSSVAAQRFMTNAIYEAARLILMKHLVSTSGALWAVFHPPPPPDFTFVAFPQGMGVHITLVTLSCLMTWQAIKGIRWRRQLSHGDYGEHTRRASDGAIPIVVPTKPIKNGHVTSVEVPTPAPVTHVEFVEAQVNDVHSNDPKS